MEKSRTQYYSLVGFKGDELYMLDTTFEYENGMKGATGTVFQLYTQAQVDEMNELENAKEQCEEWWRLAVMDGKTQDSLDEFTEMCIKTMDGVFIGQDCSSLVHVDMAEVNKHWKAYQEQLGNTDIEEIVTMDCRGGGRCFSKNDKFDYVINPARITEINKFEA